MRFDMLDNQVHVKFTFLVLVLLSAARVCADEVTWIPGASSPTVWTLQPKDPNDGDMIYFSGPTRVYLSYCVAERTLGGRPVLEVNVNTREVRLRFQPPASENCTTLSPVCGLEGSFGHLAAGQWVFLCAQSGISVSIPFTVTPDTHRIVHYVDPRAKGLQDGTSWIDAFTSLQSALAAAKGPCEVRVARGMYTPDVGSGLDPGDPAATFRLKNGVVLKGGYAGVGASNPNQRDVIDHETVLSGDLYGNDDWSITRRRVADHPTRRDNCLHVVTATDTDATAVLDGFTIRGGHAYGSSGPDSLTCGGGVRIDSASPVFRNCLIERNAAGYYGGGIYSRGVCSPVFIECVIADNWSYWRGGGMYKDWGSDISMERCLISGNATIYDGGGIAGHTDGNLILSNCILSGNLSAGVDSGRGGAIYCSLGSVQLRHCTLVGNSATYGAGLAFASAGGFGRSAADIHNCILWDRGDSLWSNDGSAIEVVYSDVQGGWPGDGNRDVDPRFVDPGHWDEKETPGEPDDDIWFDGDYRLAWQSSCVDAGDPREAPGASARDFAGRPRLSGVAVDMGAYEQRNEPPVADGGPNVAGFSVNGATGSVVLDASRSLDPEGQPLSYRWYRSGVLVSTQVQATVDLPVGQHTFTLIVNDGLRDSAPDEVLASVTTIIPTTAFVSPREIDRKRTDQSIIALIALPAGKRTTDFDMEQPMLLFPGGIEAMTQTLVPWLNGKIYAMAKFDRARLMAAVPMNGSVELRIVGGLTDGRYFSGADTVKIK